MSQMWQNTRKQIPPEFPHLGSPCQGVKKGFWTSKNFLYFLMFMVGIYAQIGQIVMFREVMALFHGTELLFGSFLGSWVIWTALGAGAAEFFLNKKLKKSPGFDLLKLFEYSMYLNGFVLAFQILFLRFYPVVFSVSVIPRAFSFYGAIKTVFLASFPFAFLMGAQFNFILQLNLRNKLGLLYRLESMGAVVGGLLTSFILVEFLSPLRIAFITGALYIIVNKKFLEVQEPFFKKVPGRRRHHAGAPVCTALEFSYVTNCISNPNRVHVPRARRRHFGIIPLLLIFLSVFPFNLDRLTQGFYWKKRGAGFSLVESNESRYGRIEVLKNPKADQFLLFHNSALVSTIENDSEHRFEKQLADLCLTQHPAPGHVLLIGGSLSAMPEQLLKHGIKELKAVELDPLLYGTFERYLLTPREKKGIIFAAEDGRSLVLSEPGNHYDMVIVFSAEPDNASVNRFCTREFFLQVDRILKPDGVFCLFLPGHGAAHEYLAGPLVDRTASVYKAMKSVYKHILAAQVNGHLLIGAQTGNRLSIEPEVLGKRLVLRPDARPFYQLEEMGKLRKEKIPDEELAAYFSALFGGVLEQNRFFSDTEAKTTQTGTFQDRLEGSGVKMNRDSHPAAVGLSMKLWESITAPGTETSEKSFLAGIFELIGDGTLPDVLLFPGVFIFIHLILFIIVFSFSIKKKRPDVFYKRLKNYTILLGAFITGAFSITTEIILLSLYQSLTGYLYYSVGILLAVFMAGLALGAKMTDREAENLRGSWIRLSVIFLCMILLCLLTGNVSLLLSGLKSKTIITLVFVFLMFMDGILCGAAFPLLGFLIIDWKSRRPGAWIYAGDLAGAGLGAFFIAPFLIPAAGIPNTLFVFAFLLLSLLILSIPLSFASRKQ